MANIKVSPTNGVFLQPANNTRVSQSWVEQGFRGADHSITDNRNILENLEDFVSFTSQDILEMPDNNWLIFTKIEAKDSQGNTKVTLAITCANANPILLVDINDLVLIGNSLNSPIFPTGQITVSNFLQDPFIKERHPIQSIPIPPSSNGRTMQGILDDIKRVKGQWDGIHPFWTVKFSRESINALARTQNCVSVGFIPIIMSFQVTDKMPSIPPNEFIEGEYFMKVETLLAVAVDGNNNMILPPLWSPNAWRPNYPPYNNF